MRDELQGELATARAENDDMMTEKLEQDEEIERLMGQLSRATRSSQVLSEVLFAFF